MKNIKFITITLIAILTMQITVFANSGIALPTNSDVYVNNSKIEFGSYNIDGYNYFKLRDIAYVLNDTNYEFEVNWNPVLKAVDIITGKPYTVTGGEMTSSGIYAREYDNCTSTIYLDGIYVNLDGYLIGSNNYFKLRTLSDLIGFDVEWNENDNTINIDTGDNSTDNNSTDDNTNNDVYVDYDLSDQQIEYTEEVVRLVNIEREKAGVDPFVLDENLTKVANIKSQDMHENDYFAHFSPTYGNSFEMLIYFNIPFGYSGENIAVGYYTPEEVVSAWLNSPNHKSNLLNANFTKLGTGYCEGYWTQLFTD